jgi:hypothetical protein
MYTPTHTFIYAGVIDDERQLEELAAEMQPRWEREQKACQESVAKAEQARQSKARVDEARRRDSTLREEAESREEREREKARREHAMDPEERARLDALLMRYAYHVEEVDEGGNLVLTETMDGEELGSAADLSLFHNDNVERVREAEKLSREQYAVKVREERARNRQQQERERLRRETVKQGSEKKEKRRM